MGDKKEKKSQPLEVLFWGVQAFAIMRFLFLRYRKEANSLEIKQFDLKFQLQVLAQLGSYLSLYFISLVCLVMFYRIFNRTEPLKPNEANFIYYCNRILLNTIEQALIFFPLLTNSMLNSTKEDFQLFYAFGMIWLIFRVIYAAGMLTGYFLNRYMILRAGGFAGTVFSSILLILETFGYGDNPVSSFLMGKDGGYYLMEGLL